MSLINTRITNEKFFFLSKKTYIWLTSDWSINWLIGNWFNSVPVFEIEIMIYVGFFFILHGL